MKNLGEAIRRYRIVGALSASTLAEEIGITPRSLARIERGENCEGDTVLKAMRWLLSSDTEEKTPLRKQPEREGAAAAEQVA